MLPLIRLPSQTGRTPFPSFFACWLTLLCVASSAIAADLHKIEVANPANGVSVTAQGGRLLEDYGSYQLYEAPLSDAGPPQRTEVRDDYDVILLNSRQINTRSTQAKALTSALTPFEGKRLHLVQFVGPVQPQWRKDLETAGVQIVSYIPQNAYLVYGNLAALGVIQKLAASAAHIQWQASYQAEDRIHPLTRTVDEKGNPRDIGTDLFSIQLIADAAANPATEALLDKLQLEPGHTRQAVLHYVNIVVGLAPEDLLAIAARPDVISILPFFPPSKFDERQDQIIAGNLSAGIPNGPGYLAWLASKGLTQQQFDASGFVVDISDSGIDDGTTAPNHFGLYTTGNINSSSRVVYNRLQGTPTRQVP